jgi:hypothetical protein
VILDILAEMAKIPAAFKAWKGPVSEAFNDSRFFNSTPTSSTKWRPMVKNLMDSDKQGFSELISTWLGDINTLANSAYVI